MLFQFIKEKKKYNTRFPNKIYLFSYYKYQLRFPELLFYIAECCYGRRNLINDLIMLTPNRNRRKRDLAINSTSIPFLEEEEDEEEFSCYKVLYTKIRT